MRACAWATVAWLAVSGSCAPRPGEPAPEAAVRAEARGDAREFMAGVEGWRVLPAEGVEASIHPADGDPSSKASGHAGRAMRLDYHFKTGGGFVVVRREVALDLPENYEFSFRVRGEGLRNNLEFKLIDDGKATGAGESVWWVNRRAFEFPREWTRLTNQKRHFTFAWGPSGGVPLRRLGAIEFAVASAEGGKGSVWFDALEFRERPAVRAYAGTPTARDERGPVDLRDGALAPAWRPRDARSALTIDFGQAREFGGVRIEWDSAGVPAGSGAYDVLISGDGREWTAAVRGQTPGRERDVLFMPDTEARLVRLEPARNGAGVIPLRAIRRVDVVTIESARDANTFLGTLARAEAPGLLPRWARGEQSFWTVVGVPDDEDEGLINEEGQVECARGAFSIEPFVVVGERVLTWADGAHEASLAMGRYPVPTVVRTMAGLRLSVTAAATGRAGDSALIARYELENTGSGPARGALVLAIRPMQVNPPAQFLNLQGGIGRISATRDEGGVVRVDDHAIVPAAGEGMAYRGFEARASASGVLPLGFGDGVWMGSEARLAGGELAFAFDLAPGEKAACGWAMPFRGERLPGTAPARLDETALAGMIEQALGEWRERVGKATLRLPPSARAIEDAFYAQQGYILINKDGPGFQPGSRSYERSWIRDGSMTSAAMLQLGHDDLAKGFVRWYASFQFPDGKVPCVVDRRGPDPVPEHDSHGQLIMAIANVHRFAGDAAFAREQFEHVRRAVAAIEALRAQRQGPDYADGSGKFRQEPGKPAVPLAAFRGLLPESISHEGYSAKPMHSYWDDLFAYRGLKDAVYLARVVGEADAEASWSRLRDEFARDLAASYALAMKTHGIDYLPGCVELGDFDATSTTVALWPVQAQDVLPREALVRTFERYWAFFTKRRDHPRGAWEAYTPYELRTVNAMVHLGERDRAVAALEWFMLDQHPPGWRHWAEVVWSDPRTPKFIGDMPHTWVGSDFLNAVRSMMIYEDESRDALVVFAGVPDAWARAGVSFAGFRTWYGPIDAAVGLGPGGGLRAAIAGGARVPPGGIVIPAWPGRSWSRVTVNGSPADVSTAGDVTIRALPAEVRWEE